MQKEKFTVKNFNKLYPNDNACLNEIFKNRYSHVKICPSCNKKTNFYKVKNRKVYACQYCGYQISPLADTIFHKSPTSLRDWFYSIYLFSVSKNGVSAKELERQLGVTYKCAWRIAKQIRQLFTQNKDLLSDIIEIDETYIGGKHSGKRGRGSENKTAVMGLAQRKGYLKAKVVKNTNSHTVKLIIRDNVKLESDIVTDEYRSYHIVKKMGFNHQTISHVKEQWANGTIHVNTIEGFWSQLKRSINGTYHCVSPKYLQAYVDEFVYRYNYRLSSFPLFLNLVLSVGKQV
jgi:transposase-like protein